MSARATRPGAYDGSGRRVLVRAVLPLAALFALTVGVITATTSVSSYGIERTKLDRSLATAFGHLYRMQTAELHRPGVTEAQLATSASCDKGGPWSRTPGRAYKADGDGPQEVNGFFQVRTASGDVPNPLWQVDGLIDLLART